MTVVLWVPLTTVPLLDEELSTCERAAQVKKKRPTGTPPSQRDPRERMLSVIHATRSLSPEASTTFLVAMAATCEGKYLLPHLVDMRATNQNVRIKCYRWLGMKYSKSGANST